MYKKILCIGNNSQDTDDLVTDLAKHNHTKNYGLVSDSKFNPCEFGYYHTTLVDIPFGGITELAKQFDQIILLDQPAEQWTSHKILLASYKVMKHLESLGIIDTIYKDNNNVKKYLSFDHFLNSNKSFCIYPWIHKIDVNGALTLCSRSTKHVTTQDKLKDWKTDPSYQVVRQKMLKGELLPDHCSVCYDYEKKNIESYRQFDTKEWISQLDISCLEDLENISHPYYYEPKTSNKCNIMCRGCQPVRSHLIAKEFKLHNISHKSFDYQYSNFDIVDISTLNEKSRVYLAGGEPTIMKEVFDFMRKCIELGKTDFELTFGTNGVKLSPTFLKLVNHFQKVNFSFSLDGYGPINDYWRHGSNWDQIIANAHLLHGLGHNISINTVPGIYNVTNLHLLFEFLDREFPYTTVYIQINYNDFQSAYNHPLSELVVESMAKCKQTKTYLADGKSCKTGIDSLYDYYSKKPQCDLKLLKKFFEFNDKLDQIRNIKLADYIPELESCRSLIT